MGVGCKVRMCNYSGIYAGTIDDMLDDDLIPESGRENSRFVHLFHQSVPGVDLQ